MQHSLIQNFLQVFFTITALNFNSQNLLVKAIQCIRQFFQKKILFKKIMDW